MYMIKIKIHELRCLSLAFGMEQAVHTPLVPIRH